MADLVTLFEILIKTVYKYPLISVID